MQNKLDHWVGIVKKHLDEADELIAEGSVELGDALKEYSFDDVPPEILSDVRKILANAEGGCERKEQDAS